MDRVIIYHLYKFPEAKTKSDQELEPNLHTKNCKGNRHSANTYSYDIL